MAYAKLDANNRIIFWSHEKHDNDMVEFSNGEYVNETCTDGLEDFVVENGAAVYSPTPEKEIAKLKGDLEEDDYIASKFIRALLTDDSADIYDLIDRYRSEYRTRLEQNNDKVDRINTLSRVTRIS